MVDTSTESPAAQDFARTRREQAQQFELPRGTSDVRDVAREAARVRVEQLRDERKQVAGGHLGMPHARRCVPRQIVVGNAARGRAPLTSRSRPL